MSQKNAATLVHTCEDRVVAGVCNQLHRFSAHLRFPPAAVPICPGRERFRVRWFLLTTSHRITSWSVPSLVLPFELNVQACMNITSP